MKTCFECFTSILQRLAKGNLDATPLKHASGAQVIVVEDENGNIVRESMKDTDVVARYKTMHETLVYLCHLDHEDTEAQMLEKLRVHVSPAAPAVLAILLWKLHHLHMSNAEASLAPLIHSKVQAGLVNIPAFSAGFHAFKGPYAGLRDIICAAVSAGLRNSATCGCMHAQELTGACGACS